MAPGSDVKYGGHFSIEITPSIICAPYVIGLCDVHWLSKVQVTSSTVSTPWPVL